MSHLLFGLCLFFSFFREDRATATIQVDLATVLVDRTGKTITAVGTNLNYLTDKHYSSDPKQTLLSALQQLKVSHLRFPGGEKSDGHAWSLYPYEVVSPHAIRQGEEEFPCWGSPSWPTVGVKACWDIGWSSAFPVPLPTDASGAVTFDEAYDFAVQTGSTLNVVVPMDGAIEYSPLRPKSLLKAWNRSQVLEIALEWVRYANVKNLKTVKLWEVGNESYLKSYNNDLPLTPLQYASEVQRYSLALKQIDPTILIGANGASANWWGTVLQNSGPHIDWLTVHSYPTYGMTTVGPYFDWYRTANFIDFSSELVATKSGLSSYTGPNKDSIFIALTEFNSHDYMEGGWAPNDDIAHALVSMDIAWQWLTDPLVRFIQYWNTKWLSDDLSYNLLKYDNTLGCAGQMIEFLSGNMLPKVLKSTMYSNKVRSFAVYKETTSQSIISVFLLNKENITVDTAVSFSGDTGQVNVLSALANGQVTVSLFSSSRGSPEDTACTITNGSLSITGTSTSSFTAMVPKFSVMLVSFDSPPALIIA